jgi:hypothetical protein
MRSNANRAGTPRWRRAGLAVALGVALAMAGPAGAAEEEKPTVRAEVGQPVQAAQGLMKDQRHADALAKLAEADAVANKTPFEVYTIERTRGVIALNAGDLALAEKSFEAVLASPRATPADKQQLSGALVAPLYNAKDYTRAARWIQRFQAEGGQNAQFTSILANALYLGGDNAGAAKALEAELAADQAAGRKTDEERLKLLASVRLKQKDSDGYRQVLERLVAAYPGKAYWADLIYRLDSREGFAERLSIDAYRLRRAVGALNEPADYMELAQLAAEHASFTEGLQVLEAGYAAGVLGTGADAPRQQQLRTKLAQQSRDEAAEVTRGGFKPATGPAMLNVGFAQVANGAADAGLTMIRQGIAKGGLKSPDDGPLRLGEALVLAGRPVEAAQAFAQVKGSDGAADLARLWQLHLAQPGAAGAAGAGK